MCEQAGNSMHLFVMTALELHTLVNYQYAYVPPLIANLALAAKNLRRAREHQKHGPPMKRLRLRTKCHAPAFA